LLEQVPADVPNIEALFTAADDVLLLCIQRELKFFAVALVEVKSENKQKGHERYDHPSLLSCHGKEGAERSGADDR
jgi:hypothetical protein